MSGKRILRRLYDGVFLFLFIYLLAFPELASKSTGDALAFCAGALLPSLFIYTVLSKIILSTSLSRRIMSRLGCGTVLTMLGLLCGAPIGAKTAYSLYESGKISKRHAEYLCTFTNNASVSFVIGYVGSGLFGSRALGIRLFLFEAIAAALTAFIMKKCMFGKSGIPKATVEQQARVGLREAIADGAETALSLCATVVFCIVCSSALLSLIPLGEEAGAILKSFVEFSSGCAAAASIKSPVIAAFAVGFSGTSVLLQVQNVTRGKLSLLPYFISKLFSSAVTVLLTVILS